MSGDGWLLALDTATSTIVVAAGRPDGTLLAASAFEGRYRHSQELLPAVERMLAEAHLRLPDLAGVIVGTGPGAFTGLRVGIATAKTLAHELARPIVGISTSDALLAGASGATAVWLPSGPRERLRATAGAPAIIAADAPGQDDVAVDLDGRAPESALARGHDAVAALPASLLRLGAARLAAGNVDDPERLVPAYAVPPRGAPAGEAQGGVAWARDPR
jgi:tRNA threonylcarbamoyl adenosine modification protein YeaZ